MKRSPAPRPRVRAAGAADNVTHTVAVSVAHTRRAVSQPTLRSHTPGDNALKSPRTIIRLWDGIVVKCSLSLNRNQSCRPFLRYSAKCYLCNPIRFSRMFDVDADVDAS